MKLNLNSSYMYFAQVCDESKRGLTAHDSSLNGASTCCDYMTCANSNFYVFFLCYS